MPKRLTTSQKFDRLRTNAAKLVGPRMIRVMNQVAPKVRDYIRQVYMGAGSTGPRRLARNTGAMERHTIAKRAEVTPDGVRAVIQINVPYASTHFTETGRTSLTIYPKTAKALTIPILKGANKRPPLPARAYTNKFAFGGVLYAIQRKKGIIPIFALRSSVVVPTRVNIQRDIQPYAEVVMRELIEREAEKLLG